MAYGNKRSQFPKHLSVILKVLGTQSCLTLHDPIDYSTSRILCPWNSLGKNTGVGSHSLLQGIFLTQGSNPGPLQYRWILYQLSHEGSPRLILFFLSFPRAGCCYRTQMRLGRIVSQLPSLTQISFTPFYLWEQK